uniref:Uncharacterized protein n=1 Tax=Glossina palpalis gambiensis TaxID=67801 RepID=A0A1B0C060_9MUSC
MVAKIAVILILEVYGAVDGDERDFEHSPTVAVSENVRVLSCCSAIDGDIAGIVGHYLISSLVKDVFEAVDYTGYWRQSSNELPPPLNYDLFADAVAVVVAVAAAVAAAVASKYDDVKLAVGPTTDDERPYNRPAVPVTDDDDDLMQSNLANYKGEFGAVSVNNVIIRLASLKRLTVPLSARKGVKNYKTPVAYKYNRTVSLICEIIPTRMYIEIYIYIHLFANKYHKCNRKSVEQHNLIAVTASVL